MKLLLSYCKDKNYYAIILVKEDGKRAYLTFDRLKVAIVASAFGLTLKDIREREYSYNLKKEVLEK